ncbi:MAG: glycosyltransferase family 4 protein [Saprospiraceae bacterium]|nr:glycosyltransferase family 4 protein [Saprospiraceae bacterium]
MKVLVVSNYRGVHTCRPEAEIFIGLKKRGYDVTIMTYPDAEYIENFERNGIRVIPKHPTKRFDPEFIKLLKDELISGSYDILQLYNNKAISNGVRSARNINVKVVIYRGASSNMSWWNPINYLKFFHPRVDYVVCNSVEIREKFLAVPGYKKDKAITIYKGHDIKWYADIKPHDIRKELGIDSLDLLLVNVANNRGFKAIPDLMKAMKYIPKESKITLLVIGRGMETSTISKLIEESGNADKIHILGYRKDSINIVAASDVFVLPSIGGESLTKSVVEAMSLGIVPLISDIKGNAPLVDDRVNGVIFEKGSPEDLAEKIMFLYHNRNLLPKMSLGAKQKIDGEINTQKTVQHYADFYSSIIN